MLDSLQNHGLSQLHSVSRHDGTMEGCAVVIYGNQYVNCMLEEEHAM